MILLIVIVALAVSTGLYLAFRETLSPNARIRKVYDFLRGENPYTDSRVSALTHCGDAPFMLPTSGLVGFLWDDSFRPGHRHQGIDIFAGTEVGVMPVYAAYDGYLTRQSDWKSSVIIRIPEDPLQPDRQIWTYYTHMADQQGNSFIDAAFPPGTEETFVTAGTLLGYQGNYSGAPGNPTGVHLHFSIVKSDADGHFLNELDIRNTLDPSPYLGLPLNGKENETEIPVCPASLSQPKRINRIMNAENSVQ